MNLPDVKNDDQSMKYSLDVVNTCSSSSEDDDFHHHQFSRDSLCKQQVTYIFYKCSEMMKFYLSHSFILIL